MARRFDVCRVVVNADRTNEMYPELEKLLAAMSLDWMPAHTELADEDDRLAYAAQSKDEFADGADVALDTVHHSYYFASKLKYAS